MLRKFINWIKSLFEKPKDPSPDLVNNKPWMVYGLMELGVQEYVGKHRNNKRILKYWDAVDSIDPYTADETPWCSAFANWCMMKANPNLPRTKKANARSWLKFGHGTVKPDIGDVVVFWRGKKNGWKGHVGFYMGPSKMPGFIKVLGGNQNNQVSIKAYSKSRLLGYRNL